MKKLSRYAAALAVCCLGSLSAAAQCQEIAPGATCSAAVDITSYVGMDPITGTFTCVSGNNNSAGAGATPACWLDVADSDAWYKVDLTAGTWTFTTDNGINAFGNDYQLALYDGCGGNILACNDDLGGETEANTLAAGFTVDIATAGTYWIQIDVFGTETGSWALMVYENAPTVNDCPGAALSLDDFYNGIGNSTWFDCNSWYAYNDYAYGSDSIDSADAPTRTVLTDDGNAGGCNSAQVVDANGRRIYNDVWFTITYDDENPNLLSVYPMNGWPLFGIEVFGGNPEDSCSDLHDEMDFMGCALPDGFAESANGGSSNWSQGDFTDHPRVNLESMGLTDGNTYYVRVYQYTRLLVGSADETVAPPSEGFFNIVFEYEGDACVAVDGRGTHNGCCAGDSLNCSGTNGTNEHQDFTNLSNAGMRGGISSSQGGTAMPSGRTNEPQEYLVAGGSTRVDPGCTGTDLIDLTTREQYNNNSVYYKFTVADDISSVLLPDTLLDVVLFDSLVTIPANSVAPGVPPVDVVLPSEDLRLLIETCNGLTVSGVPVLGDFSSGPVPVVSDLLCDEITTLCGADVKFTFENLRYCGVNGAIAEFYVVPEGPCGQPLPPAAAVFGSTPDDHYQSCFAMGPSTFYLPGGTYYLVVDGEDGSLANFDLQMDIEYFVPGTTISCSVADCGNGSLTQQNQQRKAALSVLNSKGYDVRPLYVAPVPTSREVEVAFVSSHEGPMEYSIVDITGRTVETGTFDVSLGENHHTFDLSSYGTGMYFASLKIGKSVTQVRLVKE